MIKDNIPEGWQNPLGYESKERRFFMKEKPKHMDNNKLLYFYVSQVETHYFLIPYQSNIILFAILEYDIILLHCP